MEAVLAIDLGATSGRAIVGYLSENKLVMEEINRFSNLPIRFYLSVLTHGELILDWLIMKVSCYYNLFIIVMKEQREC